MPWLRTIGSNRPLRVSAELSPYRQFSFGGGDHSKRLGHARGPGAMIDQPIAVV